MNKKTIFLLAILISLGLKLSAQEQTKYDISTLLGGVGLTSILSDINNYTKNEKIENDKTIVFYNIYDSHFLFLGNPVKNVKVIVKEDRVRKIMFIIEEKTIDAPQLSYSNLSYLGSEEGIVEGGIPSGMANENSTATPITNEEIVAREKIRIQKKATRKSIFIQVINQNTPITHKTRIFLDNNYTFVYGQPLCQFDCSDLWESNYTKIFIEKNNYLDETGKDTKVFIRSSLIIQSTLTD